MPPRIEGAREEERRSETMGRWARYEVRRHQGGGEVPPLTRNAREEEWAPDAVNLAVRCSGWRRPQGGGERSPPDPSGSGRRREPGEIGMSFQAS